MDNDTGKTESRTCPICETVYLADPGRLRWGRQTTCSRACSYRLRAQNKANAVTLRCTTCKCEFTRSPAHIKSKHGGHFCSRKCHYAGRGLGHVRRVVLGPYRITDAGRAGWRIGYPKAVATRRLRNNYVKSAATLAKMSIASARAIARTQGRHTSSKIEDVVADELKKLGAKFRRQRVVRDDRGRFAAVFDFWLTEIGVALEVNGTYWHADPRVYPAPRGPVQIKCVERYNRKLDLCKRLGIRVIEVWELDLKKSPADAVLRAYREATGG